MSEMPRRVPSEVISIYETYFYLGERYKLHRHKSMLNIAYNFICKPDTGDFTFYRL